MLKARVFVIAAVFLAFGCASNQASKSSYNGSVISQSEIDASHARTIYDVIRQLRPNFLHIQGTTSVNSPDAARLAVYLDGRFLGDVSSLDQLPASHYSEVRYYRPSEAAIKFGTNASGGVIALTTR
jgi:outer membrane cobalamin receptor